MIVFIVQPNTDNASVHSIHLSLDGAKATAERCAGTVHDGVSRTWEQEDETHWLIERTVTTMERLYLVESMPVRD